MKIVATAECAQMKCKWYDRGSKETQANVRNIERWLRSAPLDTDSVECFYTFARHTSEVFLYHYLTDISVTDYAVVKLPSARVYSIV